jgi:hypothetical protein
MGEGIARDRTQGEREGNLRGAGRENRYPLGGRLGTKGRTGRPSG